MILKALYDYYHRCDDLAPAGMEYKEIAFLIVIDKEGNFIRLEDCRIDAKSCKKFLVVKGVNKTSKPIANFLWENSSYILGLSEANLPLKVIPPNQAKLNALEASRKKEQAKNKKCFTTFVESIDKLHKMLPNSDEIRAIKLFYDNADANIEKLKSNAKWSELTQNFDKNLSFLIDRELDIAASKADIINKYVEAKEDKESSVYGFCLVTGKKGELAAIHSAAGLVGYPFSKLVSFQVNSGYDSYGKSKGYNASISKDAEACYTAALNRLLARDSRNKFTIANRTFVFWASSKSAAAQEVEEALFSLFGYTDKDDDPNSQIELVRQAFNAIYSGQTPVASDEKFYFLGLAPNSARIAVVYWSESELKDFARKIVAHFDDMDIVDTRREKRPFVGLHQMMSAVALGGKSSEVKPNLPEAVIKSILQDMPYPYALLMACIGRIRAEQSVSIARAAIIKAYLNRMNDNKNKKLQVMLDKENQNQGYLCGRLFATLEYASGNSNIRERYMNAASATPAAVFPTLLNLSVHHVAKLDKGGQVFFEKMKSEIMDKVYPDGFPAHLDLQDQGRFMVGYYHQRQEFYKSKEDKEQSNNE